MRLSVTNQAPWILDGTVWMSVKNSYVDLAGSLKVRVSLALKSFSLENH